LSWESDAGRAPFACHIGKPHVEVFSYAPLNLFDRDRLTAFFLQDVLEQMLHDFLRQFLAAERHKGSHAHQRALQAAHICADTAGEELKNIFMQSDLHRVGLFAQDSQARLDVWRLKLGGQAPFKSRHQPVLQIGNLRSRAVTREHDLFMSIKERVKRMKKFLLRSLLASEKLNVVNQKKIGLAITLPEFHQVTVLDRVDKLVDEQLARDVDHFHVFSLRPDELPDGL